MADHPSIIEHIISILTNKYGFAESELEPDVPFEEMDFDSLVLSELAGLLTRAYRVPLIDDELAEAGSIAAVAALVDERVAAAAVSAA